MNNGIDPVSEDCSSFAVKVPANLAAVEKEELGRTRKCSPPWKRASRSWDNKNALIFIIFRFILKKEKLMKEVFKCAKSL